MRSLEWIFVDELEPGDHVYDLTAADEQEVEVVGLDLVRTPSGPCEWRVHTSGATIRYQVMDRVPKIAA